MRVLITGGCGFIGSALCRAAITRFGWTILNVDKLTYAANENSLAEIAGSDRYELLKADVCDRRAVDAAFSRFQPDAVMHLAAESHVDRSITGSAAFVQTNIVGTHSMLEAALQYWSALPADRKNPFRFVHVSTDEVFGSLGDAGAFSEETSYDPRSPYSASKASSDHLARAWAHTFGLPVIVSNCSNNYGPYQFPEKLIPLMILNALERRPLPVYGDGQNVRDWLHVDDHVEALRLVLTRGAIGQTYCVGGKAERANLDVVTAICDIVDAKIPDVDLPARRTLITFVPDRPGHDRRYAIDSSKIERELGWSPANTFEQGLNQTVAWYLERRDWWGPIRGGRYTGERLGLRSAAS
jgi:dTDP-glucose 4,6-dehydratase